MRHLLAAMAVLALGACANDAAFTHTADTFDRVRTSPPRLRAFLAEFPKGSDLHTHLSGAAYAETNMQAAANAGWCVDLKTQLMVKPPCSADAPPLAPVLTDRNQQNLVARIVDGQSMRNFVPAPGITGHDQFFNSFGRMGEGPASIRLAEVLNRAARQKVQHVEAMVTFGSAPMKALAAEVPWSGSVQDQFAALEAKGLAGLVAPARAEVDAVMAATRAAMACDSAQPQPGCAVSVRFLQQINRTAQPHEVAVQVALGFMLADADDRVVGINIVAPEDAWVALRDYSLHMDMIGTMAARYPSVGVALHAGELTLGLVPPEQLRSHIREAVVTGRAKRIGHGVDVMYEDDPYGLLRLMAERRVAVEVNLSSNDMILGVKGADHPLPVYREAGVPVVLSTDDEGVSRIDLTHEYQRAVLEHGLGYAELKALSRNGLEYSFLPGASLWADTVAWRPVAACDGDATACETFLAGSEKARLQWKLEEEFRRFEAVHAMSR